MPISTVTLDTDFGPGPLDPRVFSGFAEHLGRCVYQGIYDPGSPRADTAGFRTDVLDALRRMRMPFVRYPGGNFVSCYDWKDGVGPRASRPRRLDYAWKSVETNQFGTDEFVQWCKQLGTQPMMAVNLGTAGAREAAELLEYCNLPAGTRWADERVKNGGPREGYGVKLWCLGNEMDGPWQAGHVPAHEYGLRARAASIYMKGLDASIQTVACGSSNNGMPTYLEYDRTMLELCWDTVDYVSAHKYSDNKRGDTAWYLAEGVEIDRVLADYAGLLAYVRGVKKSKRDVYVSFDEWNVWYHSHGAKVPDWSEAPPILEDVYNLEDALVCAQWLAAFVRRADVVKIACLAQIVNVIAPMLTRTDGLLLQSIYWPIVLFAEHAKGRALTPVVGGATYEAGARGEVPALDAAATYDEAAGEVAVFLTNRDVRGEHDVTVRLNNVKPAAVAGCDVMGGLDPKAANSWAEPDKVTARPGTATLDGDQVRVRVPAPGFASVRLKVARR